MAEIPDLDPADLPLTGTEEIHIVQLGNSRRAAISALAASEAINVIYDPLFFSGGSGLISETVQEAIDELAQYVFEAAGLIIDGDKGDIIQSGSGTVLTIDTDVVTNAKLANMATATFKGRTTAATGDPEDLTVTQATAMLNNFVGDSGSGGTKGLVPAPAAGDAAAGKFLKADGTWAVGSTVGALDDLSDVDTTGVSDGDVLTFDSGSGDWIAAAPTGGGGSTGTAEWTLTIAASDETTDLTTGDSKVTFFMPTDVTVSEVFTSVSGQSSSGNVTIDMRLNGSTVFSTPPSIQANEDTSLTGTVAVMSVTDFDKGDKIEIDIDAAGTGASGLKVTIIGEVVVTAQNLDELGDVDTTGVSTGDVLTYDGADWVPEPPAVIGKHTIWMPASAMIKAVTNGCSDITQIETSTNDINVGVLDFDDAADEHAHFNIAFPKSWNLGTISFQVFWTTTAVDTDGVAWGLQGVAISDNEAHDASWGTPVVVTDDAQGAAGEILVTAESGAVTIGGTPADDDICFFRIFRDVSDANDDMTEDARLIGIKVFYTIDAGNDN